MKPCDPNVQRYIITRGFTYDNMKISGELCVTLVANAYYLTEHRIAGTE